MRLWQLDLLFLPYYVFKLSLRHYDRFHEIPNFGKLLKSISVANELFLCEWEPYEAEPETVYEVRVSLECLSVREM